MSSVLQQAASANDLVPFKDQLAAWLQSNDTSIETTEKWIRGRPFQTIGYDDPAFASIVKCLRLDPGSRRRMELLLAERLPPILAHVPRLNTSRLSEDDFLYNLFNLCSELAVREILFEPLYAVYERLRAGSTLPDESLNGELCDALIENQVDNRLWPDWKVMLEGKRHPFLRGDVDAGFNGARLMPPAPGKGGVPALHEIGIALKYVAGWMKQTLPPNHRRNGIRSCIAKVIDTYPGFQSWNFELIRAADKHNWELWAVDCLPSHVERVPQSKEIILSTWIAQQLLGLPIATTILCHDRLGIYVIEPAVLRRYEHDICEIERARNEVVFFSKRAVVGAVSQKLTEINSKRSLNKGRSDIGLENRRKQMLKDECVGVC